MDLDVEPPEIDEIIKILASNERVCFKSQQRGENNLTKEEKANIALSIFNTSKLNFLTRFGKYLPSFHLDFFRQFARDSCEITMVLKECIESSKKECVKNRRYKALQEMLADDDSSYFTEIEMMKRNPLLYEQLVGQYLTEDEQMERDRIDMNEQVTLVKILMEGIERDDAKLKKKEQEHCEDQEMTDEDSNDNDDPENPATYSQWGEFANETKILHIKKEKRTITPEEQQLLKEEFVTSMYQQFLDGKDEDFDYETVDTSDKYDDIIIKDCDEEDKYFDSEEPELAPDCAMNEESEDELDIFMSALNQNPAVAQLSEEMQHLSNK